MPALYRFIWSRSLTNIITTRPAPVLLAAATSLTLLGLIVARRMPRRLLVVALLPVLGLVSVLVQAKGYAYHFHPVTAGIVLGWLALVAWLTARDQVRMAARLVPLAAAVIVGLTMTAKIMASPVLARAAQWPAATTAQARASRGYLQRFRSADFFPFELRQAATYLRAHTARTARVQVYGMDPYLLFLARRLSATPYIYVHDLDANAALHGRPDAAHPDAAQAARVAAIRDADEQDFLRRLKANPPAALVFMDRAPFMAKARAWSDFESHCPTSAAWVTAHYERRISFGHEHIWMPIENADE